jgi:outer membrane protein OmpU
MKKILLATTVLVGTAGFAFADAPTLSGNGRMGIVNAETAAAGDKETSFNSRVRASVSMSGATDGGVEFGGSFGIHDAGAAASGTEGSVYISASGVKLTMGGTDSASQNAVGQLAGVGYAGTGDGNEIGYLTGGDKEMALISFSASGFTGYASIGQPDNATDTFSIGAAYATDGFGFGFGYEDSDAAGTANDATQTAISASATVSGLTAKVIYMSQDQATAYDASSMGLSATYAMDAVSLTAYYRQQETSATNTDTYTGIGASYSLGGGATLAGGVADAAGLARADLGVNFSF